MKQPYQPLPETPLSYALPQGDIPGALASQYTANQQSLQNHAQNQAHQGFVANHSIISTIGAGLLGAGVGGALAGGRGALMLGAMGAMGPMQYNMGRQQRIANNLNTQQDNLLSGFKDITMPLANHRMGGLNYYAGMKQLGNQFGQGQQDALLPHVGPQGSQIQDVPTQLPSMNFGNTPDGQQTMLQGGASQTAYAPPPETDPYEFQRFLQFLPSGGMPLDQVNGALGHMVDARKSGQTGAIAAMKAPSEIAENEGTANKSNAEATEIKTLTPAKLLEIKQRIELLKSQGKHAEAQALYEQTKASLESGRAASENAKNYASANKANTEAGLAGYIAKTGRINATRPSGSGTDPVGTQQKQLKMLLEMGVANGWVDKDGKITAPASRDNGFFGINAHDNDISGYQQWKRQFDALTGMGGSGGTSVYPPAQTMGPRTFNGKMGYPPTVGGVKPQPQQPSSWKPFKPPMIKLSPAEQSIFSKYSKRH